MRWCVPRAGSRAEQKRHAECGHPQSPAATSDEACEVEDGKTRESGCQDVSLIEQVQHADEQSEHAKPTRQSPTAQHHDAEGARPADHKQLPEMLTEQGATELMLG